MTMTPPAPIQGDSKGETACANAVIELEIAPDELVDSLSGSLLFAAGITPAGWRGFARIINEKVAPVETWGDVVDACITHFWNPTKTWRTEPPTRDALIRIFEYRGLRLDDVAITKEAAHA